MKTLKILEIGKKITAERTCADKGEVSQLWKQGKRKVTMVNITPSTKETSSSVTESFFSRDSAIRSLWI